jgi:hypothetical protein
MKVYYFLLLHFTLSIAIPRNSQANRRKIFKTFASINVFDHHPIGLDIDDPMEIDEPDNPISKPSLDRQTSFKTVFNPDFDLQGQTGACHIFASLEVVYSATNGIKLSKEKLFLDHLFALSNPRMKSVDEAVDHNLKEIKEIKTCPREINWQEGKKVGV